MNLRAMSTERLLGVTARLLAAAAVLVVAGLGLVTSSGWRQIGQSYGPDGAPLSGQMPVSAKVAIAVFESSFRTAGLQLTVAAVLVAGAVVALRLHPGRARPGSLRWEVLGAGSVVLAVVLVFVGAHVFVITAPEGVEGEVSNYIGLQPMTEAALINLMPLGAALLILVISALWWARPGHATDVDEIDEGADPQDADLWDGEPENAEPEDAEPEWVSRGAREGLGARSDGHVDHSRDWSPEDFLPPR